MSFVLSFRVRRSKENRHDLELIFITRRVRLLVTMFTIQRLIAKQNVIVRLIIVTQCRSFD